MNKILILESSQTTQTLIKNSVRKAELEVELEFETKGMKFLVNAYNTPPDAIIVDSASQNPNALDLIRLIKNVNKFRMIPVALLSTGKTDFENTALKNCGADLFIHIENPEFDKDIEKLVALKGKKLAVPIEDDVVRTGLFSEVFSTVQNLNSLEDVVKDFLAIVSKTLEVPSAAIYVNTIDGVEAWQVYSPSFTAEESSDFLKVCATDFEKTFTDSNIINVTPESFLGDFTLDEYHPAGIPLSAYQCVLLQSYDGEQLGTLHVVKTGTFTSAKLELLSFAAQTFSAIVKNAIMLKEKLKFERNIRKAFSRFVPEQIIDELVQGAERETKVGVGEKRDVAILFSDIRSFTNISERNKPETIVAFLNRYFTIMCTIIKKHGGTIDKFIGDAIMALFGAPVSYEDNARRAVAAAYEMREALASVPLEDLILPEGMKFDIGIGIHYGDVIVGSIGSDDKTDYSVIGDNVNLASRLEGLTKTYGAKILVSQAVKDDINADEFIFRPLDDVKVKGKAKAVPIYSVDRNLEEFSEAYRDCYRKGFKLYKQGTFNLAKEYFEQALAEAPGDKAAKLMLSRCEEFIKNPPVSWDGAIAFTTK